MAQSPVVPPGMSVLDYVLLGRTPYIPPLGRESAADLAAVDDVLDRLDLAGFHRRELATLSGGERQRVFLARALAQGATLLLLDEPTSALDIGHQQEVLELVDQLRRAHGLTVLATMHDLSLAGEYADRMVLLADGRVVAAGPPDRGAHRTPARHATTAPASGSSPATHGPLVVPIRRRPAYTRAVTAVAQVDDREEGALGVAEGGEPAGRDVAGWHQDGAAQFGGAGRGGVRVGHREVHRPVRRQVGREVVGQRRHHPGDDPCAEPPPGVRHPADRLLVRLPAEHQLVEDLRALRVRA